MMTSLDAAVETIVPSFLFFSLFLLSLLYYSSRPPYFGHAAFKFVKQKCIKKASGDEKMEMLGKRDMLEGRRVELP